MTETAADEFSDHDHGLLINEQAFNRELPELREKFAGQWVAYFSGCLVANALSEQALQEKTNEMDIARGMLLIRYVDNFVAG